MEDQITLANRSEHQMVSNLRGNRVFDRRTGCIVYTGEPSFLQRILVFAFAAGTLGTMGSPTEAQPVKQGTAVATAQPAAKHGVTPFHHRSIWAVKWAAAHPAEEAAYQKGLMAHHPSQPRVWHSSWRTVRGKVGTATWHTRHGRRYWRSARAFNYQVAMAPSVAPMHVDMTPAPKIVDEQTCPQTTTQSPATTGVVPAIKATHAPIAVQTASAAMPAPVTQHAVRASANPAVAPQVMMNAAPTPALVQALQSAGTASAGPGAASMPHAASSPTMSPEQSALGAKPAGIQVAARLEPPVLGANSGDSATLNVTLDFVAADINDVLKSLSMQTHTNIVAGADVKGNVTVSLSHVSLDDALDMITKLSGFQYAKVGRTYVVGTGPSIQALTGSGPNTMAGNDIQVRTLRFHYADPTQLVSTLQKLFPETQIMKIAYNSSAQQNVSTGAGAGGPSGGGSSSGAGGTASAGGASSAGTSTTTANSKFLSSGGLLVIKGPAGDLNSVEQFVREADDKLVDSIHDAKTSVYDVRYMAAQDLINTLNTIVPTLLVTRGPSNGFSLTAPTTADAGGITVSTTNYGSTTSAPTAPTQGTATVTTTGGSGYTLLLTGTESDIQKGLDILKEVDVMPAQIVYDAKITEVNLNKVNNLGLNWSFTGATTRIGELPDNTNTTVDANGPTLGDKAGQNIFKFGTFGRTAVSDLANISLDAVFTDATTKILADPNIAAVDGQQAAVFIGDTVNYVSSITQTTTGPSVTTAAVNVGIKLYVAGKVDNDGYVTVNLHPEVSTISSWTNVPGGGQLPELSNREATTTVRVKDGDYIAIGGLINEQDIHSVTKVPGLGDLPFFGSLFRDDQKTHQRDEIVIFVKVSIQKPPV